MSDTLNEACFELKDDIGYIFINNPPANKITITFLKELFTIVEHHIPESNAKGIIITGRGRHFSSGTDVPNLKEIIMSQTQLDEKDNIIRYPEFKKYRNALNVLYSFNIPVVSAINGFCIGSGFELALHSHVRICGNGSILGLPESTFGLMPGLGGTLRFVELCGYGQALELILEGDTFTAEEAVELGLIDNIVNKKETLTYCEELTKYLIKCRAACTKDKINSYVKSFTNYYQ